MKHIVIAIDGLPESHTALKEGLALARGSGAFVTLVNVQSPSTRQLESIARGLAIIRPALAEAHEIGVVATGEVTEGDVAEQIIRLARKHDADLIVVGSRGHSLLASLVLGSVSRAVARRAETGVLIAAEPRLDRSESWAWNGSRSPAKARRRRYLTRRAKVRRRDNLSAPSA